MDDIRGFQPLASGPLALQVGQDLYQLVGATPDAINISGAPQGISGSLTFSSSINTADASPGTPVVGFHAPTILRPNGRASCAALTPSDGLSLSLLLDGLALLRNNAVPTIDGCYHCYLDPVSRRQLYADPDFKALYQGSGTTSEEFSEGQSDELLGIRFLPSTEVPQQRLGAVSIHRPILVGQGALVDGSFSGMAAGDFGRLRGSFELVDKIAFVVRPSLDRLGQMIAQSWYWIGGYAVPSDITAGQTIIPTATNAAYKRAVLLEVGG